MKRVLIVLIVLAISAGTVAPATAHEFWIQPDDFHPAPGARVELDIAVGEACEGELLSRDASHVESFAVIGPSGTRAVEGLDRRRPAGTFVAEDGVQIAAYRSRRRPASMDADRFDAYLAAEGNEDVVAWRAQHGQENEPGREVFSRCAKTLILGGSGAGPFPARLGWPLELVLLTEPAAIGAPGELSVLLLRDGSPLKDHLVMAVRCEGAPAAIEATSDAHGVVRLPIASPGQWIVSSVKVVRAPKGVDADWESFWASLTLEVPAETER